jgi:hypothetical protein
MVRDVPLDMDQALRTVYERARYDLRIDYHKTPTPPFKQEDEIWAENLIKKNGSNASALELEKINDLNVLLSHNDFKAFLTINHCALC